MDGLAVFHDLWRDACAERTPSCNGAAKALVEGVTDLFGIECVEFLQGGASAFFLVDMTSLGYARLDLNILAVCQPVTETNQAVEDFQLEQMIREQASAEGLVFRIMLQESPTGGAATAPRQDTVYLFKDDLERLFLSKTPHVAIFDIIHKYIQLARANPFNTKREARGAMFVGRKAEMAKLTSPENFDRSYLVSGARFIGKTSLLVRAHQKLIHQRVTTNRSFLVNANSMGNIVDFSHRMAWVIDPRKDKRIGFGTEHLLRLFQAASSGGRKPLLLFFDEADTMLAADAAGGWRILKTLQEAVQERYVRLVISGFRNIDTVFNHPLCPMPAPRYFESIHLDPLSRSENEELVRRPFEESKVDLRSVSDLINVIWELSQGTPFIIQFIGERLFELAIQRDPCFIEPSDIDGGVLGNFELDKFLKRYFIINTMRGAEPVIAERVAAYLYLHHSKGKPWTDGDFMVALGKAGYSSVANMEQMDDALTALHNMGFFRYTRDGYVPGLKLLTDVIRRTYPDRDSILRLIVGERL